MSSGTRGPSRTFHAAPAPGTRGWLLVAAFHASAIWRSLRVHRALTSVFGPQYRRSRDRIEIDITYRCNLRCLNCNRSCRQAPSSLDLPLERIHELVEVSLARGKRWKSIRVLGGEPTLHPRFREVIAALRTYTARHTSCSLEVVTNGHGDHVVGEIASLPPDVWVENSKKGGEVQPSFRPFNLAPQDAPAFRFADFRNGCWIMERCGMGLGPTGYFPCAVAAGIDRVMGWRSGRTTVPDDTDGMEDLAARCCAMCGRFRDGHEIPFAVREPLREEAISPSWRRAYAEWERRGGR